MTPISLDISGGFFESNAVSRARAALDAGTRELIEFAAGEWIGAPIARLSAVTAIGVNYAALLAAESGSAPPTSPIPVLETPNTAVDPYGDVAIPRNDVKTDWEVELGLVIASRASYLGNASDPAAECVSKSSSAKRPAGIRIGANNAMQIRASVERMSASVPDEVWARLISDGLVPG